MPQKLPRRLPSGRLEPVVVKKSNAEMRSFLLKQVDDMLDTDKFLHSEREPAFYADLRKQIESAWPVDAKAAAAWSRQQSTKPCYCREGCAGVGQCSRCGGYES